MQYLQLINYLTAIGHGHPEMKTIVQGDAEKIFEIEKIGIKYPVFWLESPEISFEGDNDNLEQDYNCFLVIGYQVPPTDKRRMKYAEAVTLKWMMQVLKKMNEDQSAGIIDFVDLGRAQTEPVELLSENLVGWRTQFPIRTNFCADTSEIQAFTHPAFEYDGQTFTVSATSTPFPDGYEAYFKIWLDGNPSTIHNEVTSVEIVDPFTEAYIELIYYGKGHHTIASIYTVNGKSENYTSQPYSLNPYIKN